MDNAFADVLFWVDRLATKWLTAMSEQCSAAVRSRLNNEAIPTGHQASLAQTSRTACPGPG